MNYDFCKIGILKACFEPTFSFLILASRTMARKLIFLVIAVLKGTNPGKIVHFVGLRWSFFEEIYCTLENTPVLEKSANFPEHLR